MTKKKIKSAPLAKLVDIFLELPEEAAHLVEPEADGRRGLRMVVDSQRIKASQQISTELKRIRSLPTDYENLSFSNPIVLLINQQLPKDIPNRAHEVLSRAQEYYKTAHAEADQEALMLALTTSTKFSQPPLPYEDVTEKSEEEVEFDELFAWMGDKIDLPEPKRDLTSKFEMRVKQLNDVLAAAGIMFQFEFQREFNNALYSSLRLLGESDDEGFRPQ